MLKPIIAAEQQNKVVSRLHAILKPHVLRRLKSDVDIPLPKKGEVLLYAQMTQLQKDLNTQLLDGSLKVSFVLICYISYMNCVISYFIFHLILVVLPPLYLLWSSYEFSSHGNPIRYPP